LALWLTTRTRERVSAEFVVGEGGGAPVQLGRKKVYRVTVAEKGLLWLKLIAKGKAGHGSIPTLAENANLTMARAFLNLSTLRTERRIPDEVVRGIRTVATGLFGEEEGARLVKQELNEEGLDGLLDKIALKDRDVAEDFRSLTRMIISPNAIRGGSETNVIPGTCEGKVDIRLVPGQNAAQAFEVTQEGLRGLSVQVEVETDTVNILLIGQALLRSHQADFPRDCAWLRCSTVHQHGDDGQSILTSPRIGGLRVRPVVSGDQAFRHPARIHGPYEKMNVQSLSFGTSFLCNLVSKVLS